LSRSRGLASDPAGLEVSDRVDLDAPQLAGDSGHRGDVGERARERLRLARDDQEVASGRGEHRVVGEVLAERAQHRGDQARIDLVHLEPLHQYAVVVEMAPYEAVELGGE